MGLHRRRVLFLVLAFCVVILLYYGTNSTPSLNESTSDRVVPSRPIVSDSKRRSSNNDRQKHLKTTAHVNRWSRRIEDDVRRLRKSIIAVKRQRHTDDDPTVRRQQQQQLQRQPEEEAITVRPRPPPPSDQRPLRQATSEMTSEYDPQRRRRSRSEFTIVTALFDIGRGNWTHYGRSYAEYFGFMINLLKTDLPLFVFTDEAGAAYVREHRATIADRTHIEITALQNLPFYQYKPMIDVIIRREQQQWNQRWDDDMKTHPEATNSNYIVLMNSKPYMLYFASQTDPFGSGWFYWLDAGYGHGVARFPDDSERWSPANAMTDVLLHKITLIKLVPHNLTDFPINAIYRKNVALVSGEFLGGSKDIIPHFYSVYFHVFRELMRNSYVDDDQTTLVICYQKHPSMFNLVAGDWHSVFTIFHS